MNALIRTLFKLCGHLSAAGDAVYAKDYDLRAGTYELVQTRPVMRKVTEDVLGAISLQPGMNCLDLGCGTGHATRILSRRVAPGGSVTGCDISEGMLTIARTSDSAACPNCQYQKINMVDFLKNRDADSADFISAFWSADYCNLHKLFPEIYRVLKTNASTAILINTRESLRELQQLIAPVLLSHPHFIKSFPPINFPPDLRYFNKILKQNGFRIEVLQEDSRAFSFTTGREAVVWMQQSGPAAGLISSLRESCLEKFWRIVEEKVNGAGGLTIVFRFLLFVGCKEGSQLKR